MSELITRNPYNPNITLVASSWEEYGALLCSDKSGYTGLLCASCKPGFGQTDAFTCDACLGVSADGHGEVNRSAIWASMFAYGVVFLVFLMYTIQKGVQESQIKEADGDGHGLHVTDVIKALAMYAQVNTWVAKSCWIL